MLYSNIIKVGTLRPIALINSIAVAHSRFQGCIKTARPARPEPVVTFVVVICNVGLCLVVV